MCRRGSRAGASLYTHLGRRPLVRLREARILRLSDESMESEHENQG